eukprot:m.684956 g.684956  ORF g.684956 m.684956 type:complete len:208 (-) comp58616_c0_seq1:185-808(-)
MHCVVGLYHISLRVLCVVDAWIRTHYAGDNFVRYGGEVPKFAEEQLFAWEAHARGNDVNVLTDPTKLELMHKEFKVKKEEFKATVRDSVLEKYGGAEHLDGPPKELLLAQSEHYVEYSKFGRVIKGQDKAVARSKYEEDSFPGNHSSVWGSYWKDGVWGFACCHSLERNSYCLGHAGKAIHAQSAASLLQSVLANEVSSTVCPPLAC